MRSLKIREFKIDSDTPEETVTIPLSIFKIVAKIIPKKALAALQQNDRGTRGLIVYGPIAIIRRN
jgi:hypothetical protein